jgi:hypothetical protein
MLGVYALDKTGRRERRKGSEAPVYRVGIRVEFITKKIPLISSLVTGVQGEKPLQAKLRVDFFTLIFA